MLKSTRKRRKSKLSESQRLSMIYSGDDMRAINALHTGRIFSLQMQSPSVRADMDADYASVMAVASVMGGLNSVELEEVEVLIFSGATYAEPPTKVLLFSDATYVNQPRA